MNPVNFILNLVGLVLWVTWRLAGASASLRHPARWLLLPALAVLVVARAWMYWQVGPAVHWMAPLDLGAVRLDFNSAVLARMIAFSIASFVLFLGAFYAWLLLLSVVNEKAEDSNPWLRFVTIQLGWLRRLPAVLRLILPVGMLGLAWVASHSALVDGGLAAPAHSTVHLWQQGGVVGLGAILVWKYLLLALLVLYVLNTYLYLGNRPLLAFTELTTRNLLRLVRWLPLKCGRVDLAPALGIAAVWFAFRWARPALTQLYLRLAL